MAMRKRENKVPSNAAPVNARTSSHWVMVPAHSTDAPRYANSERGPMVYSR